jgi:hypothetical protein
MILASHKVNPTFKQWSSVQRGGGCTFLMYTQHEASLSCLCLGQQAQVLGSGQALYPNDPMKKKDLLKPLFLLVCILDKLVNHAPWLQDTCTDTINTSSGTCLATVDIIIVKGSISEFLFDPQKLSSLLRQPSMPWWHVMHGTILVGCMAPVTLTVR